MRDDAKNMREDPKNMREPQSEINHVPEVVDRATFQAQLDALRVREKAHTREGDAIAAARRRLPMVEVDANMELIGPRGPVTLLDVFEGRRQLIAYYFMWDTGRPAPEQCEGCTFYTTQVGELSYLHSRDVTYATLCQGPYEESVRYRDFMGWDMPWYSAQDSVGTLLAGRQERWEDSPPGWPQHRSNARTSDGPPEWPPVAKWPEGRPIAQWPRLAAGRSDDLTAVP
jgi:hypothetical protein